MPQSWLRFKHPSAHTHQAFELNFFSSTPLAKKRIQDLSFQKSLLRWHDELQRHTNKQTSSRPQQRLSSYGGKLSLKKKNRACIRVRVRGQDSSKPHILRLPSPIHSSPVSLQAPSPKGFRGSNKIAKTYKFTKKVLLVHNNKASQAIEGAGAKQKRAWVRVRVRVHRTSKPCIWRLPAPINWSPESLEALSHRLSEDMLQSRLKPKPSSLNPFEAFLGLRSFHLFFDWVSSLRPEISLVCSRLHDACTPKISAVFTMIVEIEL